MGFVFSFRLLNVGMTAVFHSMGCGVNLRLEEKGKGMRVDVGSLYIL